MNGRRLRVSVGGRYAYCLVSPEDHAELRKYSWHVELRGYVCTMIEDKDGRHTLRMHRLVMGVGLRDPRHVDHINRVRLDNRRENLRVVDAAKNLCNRLYANKHGYNGVKLNRCGSFEAWIGSVRKKNRKYLGSFPTAELAARAYDVAALERYGEFAALNFPVPAQPPRAGSSPAAPMAAGISQAVAA